MEQIEELNNNRKGQEIRRKKRGIRFFTTVISLSVIFIFSVIIMSGCSDEEGKATVASDTDLVIPISELSDTANFYPVEIDGTALEVIAVKATDGSIRTAFNTCQVCYDSGRGYYEQNGNMLVCQNCGNRFSAEQVEVMSGGCNPVPIFSENKTVTDESITISEDFLQEAKIIFANWRTQY